MTLEHTLINEGYLEIQAGVYLNTKEHLIFQQEGWVDEDKCKNFTFAEYDYWITFEGEGYPKGVDTIEEGLLEIIGIEECRRFLGE